MLRQPMRRCQGCIGSSPTSRDGATEPTTVSATSTSTSTPMSSCFVGTGGDTSKPTWTPSLVSGSGSAERPGATSSATRGNGRRHMRTKFLTWSGPRGSTAPRTTPWRTVAISSKPSTRSDGTRKSGDIREGSQGVPRFRQGGQARSEAASDTFIPRVWHPKTSHRAISGMSLSARRSQAHAGNRLWMAFPSKPPDRISRGESDHGLKVVGVVGQCCDQ